MRTAVYECERPVRRPFASEHSGSAEGGYGWPHLVTHLIPTFALSPAREGIQMSR